ncbi:hypothetical protein ACFWSF_39660 [Streptomyces sp. NPDC058611]|uniref:hypothetical protein n=1 Tax=unclassified Streptomyces TaxID=2593676 RepID=UPI00364B151B
MTTRTTTRRSLLATAVAVPVAAVAAPLLTAAPAAAAAQSGAETLVGWTDIVLAAGVTAGANEHPQARVISIADTEYLQLRGLISCDFAVDSQLGTLPATIRPPKMTRGVCPRNNNLGINSTRVEADTSGRVMVYGPQAANKVTWVQLDNFSSVLR